MSRYLRAGVLVAALLAAAPAGAATVRSQRVHAAADVAVAGAQLHPYFLRVSYLVPAAWPGRAGTGAFARSFGPIGTCRLTVRVSARAIADAAGRDAATRLASVLPATGRSLADHGTRRNGAWRVVRAASGELTSLLTRPAPSVRRQPPGGRVWLELRFVARPAPGTICGSNRAHSTVENLGNTLATASVGGFED